MKVKNILTNVAYLLDDEKLLSAIENDSFVGGVLSDKNLLVKCVNYVNNIIATEYLHVDELVDASSTSGVIPFSAISNKTIYNIVEVQSSFGHKIDFKVTSNGVETKKGKVKIRYYYMPEDVDYEDEIKCYPTKINERIFAYGVASEFLFIKGNFDDGDIWDTRFKNSMQSINQNHKEIKMPQRSWF